MIELWPAAFLLQDIIGTYFNNFLRFFFFGLISGCGRQEQRLLTHGQPTPSEDEGSQCVEGGSNEQMGGGATVNGDMRQGGSDPYDGNGGWEDERGQHVGGGIARGREHER